jgi:hypothetical protein
LGFACEQDARRVLDVLPKRFGKYGLTLHPDKTRLVRFNRPSPGQGGPTGTQTRGSGGPPESFDFLGFTHFLLEPVEEGPVGGQAEDSARSLPPRLALQRISDWCRHHLHEPMKEQYQALQRKLQGHYQYFGIVGNGRSLWCFRERVQEIDLAAMAVASAARGREHLGTTEEVVRGVCPVQPAGVDSSARSETVA